MVGHDGPEWPVTIDRNHWSRWAGIPNYHCPTVMLDELTVRIATWIAAGVERAVISAPPGFGKTHATQCISKNLILKYPEVGFARVNINASTAKINAPTVIGHSVGTLTTFSQDGESASPIVLTCDKLQRSLEDVFNRTGQRTIVLWVDEAHLLSPSADDTLRYLKDELEIAGIRLIVFLVGQASVPRLNEKHVSFTGAITRILPSLDVDEFQLRGLRSSIDIEHSLNGFDTTCFPSGSDWSYTRFFLPHAYQNGLRLHKHASALWRVFLEEERGTDGGTAQEVPIMYFLRVVEFALSSSGRRDGVDLKVDEEFWRAAVSRSSWIERQRSQLSLFGFYGSQELH